MTTRTWTLERNSKYGGIQRLGERAPLPKDAVVSITHGKGLSLGQTILNSMYSGWFILPRLPKNENLLYAELHGDFKSGESLTITVWRGKAMTQFRDKGGHGWAVRLLTNLVFGGNATLWFLTYVPKDGQIPSAEEARRLSEQHGKMMVRGAFVRSATRPA